MAERTIKGTSVNLTIDLVRREHGEEGLERLVAAVPARVREQLPPGCRFLPASVCSFEVWAELLLAAEQLFGTEMVRTSSREGYADLLGSIYRNWVRVGEPRESVRRLPHLWEQVTSGLGDYDVLDRGDDLVIRVKLRGMPVRYRAITEERVAGTIEAMIEAAGGVGEVERCPGADATEYVVRISEPTVG